MPLWAASGDVVAAPCRGSTVAALGIPRLTTAELTTERSSDDRDAHTGVSEDGDRITTAV